MYVTNTISTKILFLKRLLIGFLNGFLSVYIEESEVASKCSLFYYLNLLYSRVLKSCIIDLP
jgi:hypothetical protein